MPIPEPRIKPSTWDAESGWHPDQTPSGLVVTVSPHFYARNHEAREESFKDLSAALTRFLDNVKRSLK